ARGGEPPERGLAVRRPHADVHRAVRDEIQGVPGRALLGDARSRRVARLLQGSDEARRVERGEVAEERDAPQQTLKLVFPARRHAGETTGPAARTLTPPWRHERARVHARSAPHAERRCARTTGSAPPAARPSPPHKPP